jgi:hypothetical protein
MARSAMAASSCVLSCDQARVQRSFVDLRAVRSQPPMRPLSTWPTVA